MRLKILFIFLSIISILALGVASYSLYLHSQLLHEKETNPFDDLLPPKREDGYNNVAKDILNIQSRVLRLENIERLHQSVELDTSSQSYQRLDTDTASFLVSLQDAKPYLNGHKLILNIGNISSATFSGFTLKLKWGKILDNNINLSTEDWLVAYEKWEKSLKEKAEHFTKALKPGSWNKVEIIITPANPEDLGYLELSMYTDTISLYQSK